MEPINTTSLTSQAPSEHDHTTADMPVISPTTSNDASITSDDHDHEQITTPPPSARGSLGTSPTRQRHHYLSEEPIIASGSYKPKYNFASLNKLKKASPPSPGPRFDEPVESPSVPSPPASPSKKAPSANPTPYSRPAGSVMISGLQRGSNAGISALRPMTPASPKVSDGRPQVSMPKSQPLSRTLFKNGQTNKPAKPQKLIVPKKPFKTVFELPLTSSEFARKDWW